MEHADLQMQPEKKPYEAPAYSVVTLEVRASVLSACLTSMGVTPYGSACAQVYSSCYTTRARLAPRR